MSPHGSAQKRSTSKPTNKATEKEIVGLIINNRTYSIFNAILNTKKEIKNYETFNKKTFEFSNLIDQKEELQAMKANRIETLVKRDNPLQDCPSSFYRTICLQLDILRNADKVKMAKIIGYQQLTQLVEIFYVASKCVKKTSLIESVLYNTKGNYYIYI